MTDNTRRGLRFLDIFAGAGGMSEGFVRAGFTPVAHVESNKAACLTLKTRAAYRWTKTQGQLGTYRDYLDGKITRPELYSLVPKEQISSVINAEIKSETLSGIFQTIDSLLNGASLDLIIGGPPCQAYSVVGRSRDKNGMIGDKRNYLYQLYAEFLAHFKPRFFVFENVTGILSAKDKDGGRYFDNMIRLFEEVGYKTESRTLSADDYGVLQQRKRLILVGNSDMKAGVFPNPESWKPNVVVQEVLGDLPAIKAGEGSVSPVKLKDYSGDYLYAAGIRTDDDRVTLHRARPHTERDLEIYRIAVAQWNSRGERLHYYSLPTSLKTHANEVDFTDRYKVVAGNLPVSQTVVAHIAKDGHYYIHPDIEQNRSSTLTMAARASFCCTPIDGRQEALRPPHAGCELRGMAGWSALRRAVSLPIAHPDSEEIVANVINATEIRSRRHKHMMLQGIDMNLARLERTNQSVAR